MKWNTGYRTLGRNDRIAISLSLSTDAVVTGLLSTLVLPARVRPGRFSADLCRRGNRSPGGGVLSGEIRAGVYYSSWFRNRDRIVPSSVIFAPVQGLVATADGANSWLSGRPNATIPQWIWISGITVTGSLLVILVFTLFLRQKVEVATRSLEESRERYRTVAKYAHGWEFWIAPNGQFLYVSPNTQAITGYAAGAKGANGKRLPHSQS